MKASNSGEEVDVAEGRIHKESLAAFLVLEVPAMRMDGVTSISYQGALRGSICKPIVAPRSIGGGVLLRGWDPASDSSRYSTARMVRDVVVRAPIGLLVRTRKGTACRPVARSRPSSTLLEATGAFRDVPC